MKKILAALLCLALVLMLVPQAVFAVDGNTFAEKDSGMQTIRIPPAQTATLSGLPEALAATTDCTYVDENGDTQTTVGFTVTRITAETAILTSGWYVVDSNVTRASTITVSGDVKLILMDGCTLKVNALTNLAGITVSAGNTLTIYGQAAGTGSLEATGTEYGAGIGGGMESDGGTVIINGGIVTASGGYYGAGIGGGGTVTASGDGGDGGTVIINGGTVTATCGYYGTGIGGGLGGDGGSVEINGGIVEATGAYGAGIGGGAGIGDGGSVEINGGMVEATSSFGGAGIGGGLFGSGDTIIISGGMVEATSSFGGGAGIGGGGEGGNGGTIIISGGTVEASGSDDAIGGCGAGIGGGSANMVFGPGGGGEITISGGVVRAAGSGGASDIGPGYLDTDGTLTISGTAAVFLKNDRCITPTTSTHTHESITGYTAGGTAYGLALPSAWSAATNIGTYLRLITLSYDANGGQGTVASVEQHFGTTITTADGSSLSRTGYDFDAWNTEANGGTAYTPGNDFEFTANTTLYAQWTVVPYTITYDLKGGAASPANPTSYTLEAATITLANPTKTEYEFAGWSGTGITGDPVMTVTIPAGSTGNRVYTANWTATAYTLTYDLDGGTASPANPASYMIESGDITLVNPAKTGYDFAGWSGTGITGDPVMIVTIPAGSTGDRTYTARWALTVFALTYDLDGGAVNPANPTSYTVESAAITLTNPTKTDYDFAGWSGTGITADLVMTVTIAAGSVGDRTYTAHWTPIAYALTYDLDGGTANNPTRYTAESAAITLTNPTKPGYDFAGWSGTGISGDPVITVTIHAGSIGNRSYTAHWTPTPSGNSFRTLTDSATGISISGNDIHRGAQLNINTINAQSLPVQIREAIASGQMIAEYDITLSGGFRGKITLSFPVGTAYEGQVVTILHYVNGQVETYKAVVENSMATITVNTLSPFVVLSNGVMVPNTVVTDPPKTGDAAKPIGFVMLGLAVLCAGYLIMKRRKALIRMQ